MTHQDTARVHLVDRLWVVDAVPVAAAQHAEVIGVRGDVRQKIADLESRLAAWPERLDRAEQGILRHLAPSHHLTKTARQRLAGVLGQVRFGIEQIHVAWPTVHEQPDNALGSGGEVGMTRCQWIARRPGLLLQQTGQCQSANASARLQQKLTAIVVLRKMRLARRHLWS